MGTVALPAPQDGIRDAVRADSRVYLASWDRLRIIAALDTVAVHLTGYHVFFGFGLPLFLILSVALGVSKREAPTTRRFLARRSERIVAPWLFWSVVLAVWMVLRAYAREQPLLGWAEPRMLLYGPRIHLWFLPFIVVAGLVAHWAHRHLPKAGRVSIIAAIVLAGGLLWLPPQQTLGWPFDQWTFALPTLPLGYALGRSLALAGDLRQFRLWATGSWVLFCAVGLAVVALEPRAGGFLFRYAGGCGLLVGGAWLPARGDSLTRRLAPLMLGVYVLHPALYSWTLKPLFLVLGLHPFLWLRVAVTFPFAMGVTALLRQTPLRRVL